MRNLWKKVGISLVCLLTVNGLSACVPSELPSSPLDPPVGVTPKETINTTGLIETTATVKATDKGLQIYSDNTYDATIKGTFEMGQNVSIDFGWIFEKADTMGKVVFRLVDVTDEENCVDIVFQNHSYNNGWTAETLEASGLTGTYSVGSSRYRNCSTYVQWQDQIRSANAGGNQIYNEIKTDQQSAYPIFTVDPLQAGQIGTLGLFWHMDVTGQQVLTVTTAGNNSGTRTNRIRARFDGSYDKSKANDGFKYDGETLSNSCWGLPYVVFSEGYTITILSQYGSPERSTGLELKKICVDGEYSYNQHKGFARSAKMLGEGTVYALTTTQAISMPSFYRKLVE